MNIFDFLFRKNLKKELPEINENSFFEEHSGLIYPIAYRKKGQSKIDSCPYCKKSHEHDTTTLGHRTALCSKYFSGLVIIKGKIIPVDRGYIIREY